MVALDRGAQSPFIGRTAQVFALRACVERLLAGQGGIVSIVGEAGLGKSRLMAEVRRQVADRGLLWREGGAVSFGQTFSYHPFLEILRSDAGILGEDGEKAGWTGLEDRVMSLFPEDGAEILPYLAALLGLEVRGELAEQVRYLSGEAMGRQIFLASRRYFERLAQQCPLLLVFEDWQWADASSAALLEHLLPLVERVPLLVCLLSRPSPSIAGSRLLAHAVRSYSLRYTSLPLAPLSASDSADLLHHLLGLERLPPAAERIILDKTDGNPFFLEEVVRSLIHTRTIVRGLVAGGWRVTQPIEQLELPATIQEVILARVSRLTDASQAVLAQAAVIGESFSDQVLRVLNRGGPKLDQYLGELQQLGLIREIRPLPRRAYCFEHALTQEAIYQSLSVEQQRELHGAAARGIETAYADHLEEYYGLLAYHYARAEAWEKAQEYLLQAGDRAGQIAGNAEAVAHYHQALIACDRAFGDRWDLRQRVTLERKMGEALLRRGEHEQASEYLERALRYLGHPLPTSPWAVRRGTGWQLLRQVGHRLLPWLLPPTTSDAAAGPVADRLRTYEALAWIHWWRTDVASFVYDVITMLNVSERHGCQVGTAQASVGLGLLLDVAGLPWLARRYHHRGLALAEQSRQAGAVSLAHNALIFHTIFRTDDWDLAAEYCRRGMAVARQAGDLRLWATIAYSWALLLRHRGQFESSMAVSQEMIRDGEDAADRQVRAWGLHSHGRTLWHLGALAEAAGRLSEAAELFASIPDNPFLVYALGDLGQCYLRQERLTEALAVLDEAEELIAARSVPDIYAMQTRLSLADARLFAAEHARPTEREALLKQARAACEAAFIPGRSVLDGRAGSQRVQGTYQWLRGSRGAAERWWRRSIETSERLGARYELGRTYLERGRYTGDAASLTRAEAVFAEIGAQWDLAQARRYSTELTAS